jgi:hypothetical protein
MEPGAPAPKQFATDSNLITDRGALAPGQVARITFTDEERVKLGYETPGQHGAAWWPSL